MEWMVLPYGRYFEIAGRSRRREYWLFLLFYTLVLMVINATFGVPMVLHGGPWFSYAMMVDGIGSTVGNLFWLASAIPGFTVAVRRLHDIDRSGWWLLLGLVPILGWFTLLVFMCLDGTAGSNRFGADPKARGVAEVFR